MTICFYYILSTHVLLSDDEYLGMLNSYSLVYPIPDSLQWPVPKALRSEPSDRKASTTMTGVYGYVALLHWR